MKSCNGPRRKVSFGPPTPAIAAPEPPVATAVPYAWESDALAGGRRQIESADSALPVGMEQSAESPMLERVDQAKKSAEASVILSALNKTRWNRRQAADLLQIDYKALLYKMKKLQISA